ncbi:MAG: helix-turn-helix domain-containing protein [Betaproteobacteria bacterium]
MKRINLETKTGKIFTALQAGQKLTASQAAKRFGVKNLSAEASRIRQAGYAVYANSRLAGNGVTVTEYELGTPSRRIVALGYKAASMGITI